MKDMKAVPEQLLETWPKVSIVHESHHRGGILLTLKECGHKLDQPTQYAIWEWDKI